MEDIVYLLVLFVLVLAAVSFFKSVALARARLRIARLEKIAVVQGEATERHQGALESTRDVIGILETRLVAAEKSSKAALMWAASQIERQKKVNGS